MFGQPVGSADVRRGQVRCSGHDPTGSPNTYVLHNAHEMSGRFVVDARVGRPSTARQGVGRPTPHANAPAPAREKEPANAP
jgi:hypothetical protein